MKSNGKQGDATSATDDPISPLLCARLRDLRHVGQPQQPPGIVEKQGSGVGQRAVPGGPIDQPLPCCLLQPPDGLADRRLGAM